MRRMGSLAGAAVAAALIPLAVVLACGPDFEPEVFVPASHPEHLSSFARGRLGVVQPGYYHSDLIVAYRYLSGGKLSEAEQRAYLTQPPDREYDRATGQEIDPAIGAWLAARATVEGSGEGAPHIEQDRVVETKQNGYTERDEVLNCTDGAFRTAAQTLAARVKTWGAASGETKEWLAGQDAVFSNCDRHGTLPGGAPASGSPLLKADRAYQIAAAHFYAGEFDTAAKEFEAIGRDGSSPWQHWGEYLAGRAEVREAAETAKFVGPWERAEFDAGLLTAARSRLERVQSSASDAVVKHAAMAELNFIAVRLDPQGRLDGAALALAGPAPDAEFAQDSIDLDFLLDRAAGGVMGGDEKKAMKLVADTELTRWIAAAKQTPGAGVPGDSRSAEALPWLAIALAQARPDTPGVQERMAAAAKVPESSPGYVMVNYHRARLLAAERKSAAVRVLTTKVLGGLAKDEAAERNEFAGLRMPTARTLDEFLTDAPRTTIEMGSEESGLSGSRCGGTGGGNAANCVPALQFDSDAADAINQEIPLALLEQIAVDPVLPVHLRQAVAWMGWVRAVGLDDGAATARLAAQLPSKVRATAGESDGFPATLAMLRNAGFGPYLEQGVQRSSAYNVDSDLRGNWWCGRWGDGVDQRTESRGAAEEKRAPPSALEFLTEAQRKEAAEEQARLNKMPLATVWLGRRAIDQAKAHPDDKNAAEALALTVRATHYACSGQENIPEQRAVSKEAFTLLHEVYPASAWAAKTKYYY